MSVTRLDDHGQPVTFPLWRAPSWFTVDGKDEPLNEVTEEWFDQNGRLCAMIQAYGTIWGAYRIISRGPKPESVVMGFYFTKNLAKLAIETEYKPSWFR